MSSRERAQTCSWARTQWRVWDVGRGRNGAYGMSGADLVGDNGKAGADGKDGRARTRIAQTVLWARTEAAGTGMWARTFWAV
jgi:hypothetical protein